MSDTLYKYLKLFLFAAFIVIFAYLGYRYVENDRYSFHDDGQIIYDKWTNNYAIYDVYTNEWKWHVTKTKR